MSNLNQPIDETEESYFHLLFSDRDDLEHPNHLFGVSPIEAWRQIRHILKESKKALASESD